MRRARTWQRWGWGILLCLPMLAWGVSDTRKPLRYPFGLKPSMTPTEVKALLKSKGLTFVSEKDAMGTHFVTWRLSQQIIYDNFIPAIAVATFDKQKLSSFSLGLEAIPSCGEAQPIYISALGFLHDNYQVGKEAQFTEEPTSETLDCGPHFNTDDYQLQLTSKEYVTAVTATQNGGRFDVEVTYHWAGLLNLNGEEEQNKKLHGVQENL